jgi:predicted membrane protein
MIKERGLATLSVFGNIVVTWSFFGVNELGVGLHSYGFTEGRLLKMLLFCLSQLLIFGIGCLPRSCWWSKRVNDDMNNKLAGAE